MNMDQADVMIIDECDELILQYPYEFKNSCATSFKGIWNLNQCKVIGLSATTSDTMIQVIEDVVTGLDNVTHLEFKSEYEFLTGKSLLNITYEMLNKDENLV